MTKAPRKKIPVMIEYLCSALMFDNLFDFKAERSKAQALGFYIAYLLFLLLIGALLGGVVGASGGDFQDGLKTGQIAVIILCPLLSFLIIAKKGALSVGNVVLALVSGILAMLGGGVLGLIPAGILTTRRACTLQ